jgi:NADPH:quinone reductase-like Zn-dependent oxidoreductase
MAVMRAVVVPRHGSADVLEYRTDWPRPERPGPGEILVAVEAAGLNPSDFKMRAGGAPPEELPYVAGREAAGRIVATGPEVADFVAGDAVFAFFGWHARPGGHAEQVVIPASMVARRPAAVPVIDAASLPLAGLTALQALRLLDVPSGGRVVITGGAGGVGVFAVQLARLAGLEVVATAGPDNQGFVRALGAAETVDYHDPDAADRLAGATHLLDLVGPATIRDYQSGLAPGARIIAIAGLPAEVRPDLWAQAMRAQPSGADLTHLAGLLDAGSLRAAVARTFPLEAAADAHRLLEGGHVRGKLVIVVNG